MGCEGQILASDICDIIRKVNSKFGPDLTLLNSKLKIVVEGIDYQIKKCIKGDERLYNVLLNLFENWVQKKPTDATIGTLYAILVDMDQITLAATITANEFAKYVDGNGHICMECRIVQHITKPMLAVAPTKRKEKHHPLFTKDYEIKGRLGSGGFGVVFSCVKKNLTEKKIAIKLVPGDEAEGEREVKTHDSITQHRNIVGHLDAWRHKFTPDDMKSVTEHLGDAIPKFMCFGPNDTTVELLCISMELCGEDLRKWLSHEDYVVDVQKATDIFQQIICGIKHIHDHGIFHRDIKPENIFFGISETPVVKIGDMGIAIKHGSVNTDTFTTGAGTSLYCAPEQKSDTYDKAVDIYAAGIILMEMFCPVLQPSRNKGSNKLLAEAIEDLSHSVVPVTVKDEFPKHAALMIKMAQRKPVNRMNLGSVLHAIEVIFDADSEPNQDIIEQPFQDIIAQPVQDIIAQPVQDIIPQTDQSIIAQPDEALVIDEKKKSMLMKAASAFSLPKKLGKSGDVKASKTENKEKLPTKTGETGTNHSTPNVSNTTTCATESNLIGDNEREDQVTENTSVKSKSLFKSVVSKVYSAKKSEAAPCPQEAVVSKEPADATAPENAKELGSAEMKQSTIGVAVPDTNIPEHERINIFKEAKHGECNACIQPLTPKRYHCSYCPNYNLCKLCYNDELIVPEHKGFHPFSQVKPAAEGSTSVFGGFKRTLSSKH